jgi:RimJ/RimL family protein N-acetyltransferase
MPLPLPLPERPLHDGDLTLREWGAPDLPVVLSAGLDPVVSRFRYSLPRDFEGAERWLAEVVASRLRGDRLELAVALEGVVAGSVALADIAHGNAMIRYWLLPEARGRGVGTRAVRLVAAWAFTGLGLGRLAALVETDNLASTRLLERCGFVREGLLRLHMEGRAGRRVDSFIYGLLPEDLWPENPPAP